MKALVKKLLFDNRQQQVIKGGLAKGLKINYDINNRFQHLVGLYEREIYPYLKKGIGKAATLVDIGANDGYYVLAFLKTGKKVIACEPGPIVTELINNAASNGFAEGENFTIEKRLVGLNTDPAYVSIKELLKNAKGPFFFLIDIDGGELNLLQSCGEDFDHSGAIWVIETHTKELEEQCISFLEKHHYKVSIIKNAWWRFFLPELRPLAHNRWLYATYKNSK